MTRDEYINQIRTSIDQGQDQSAWLSPQELGLISQALAIYQSTRDETKPDDTPQQFELNDFMYPH